MKKFKKSIDNYTATPYNIIKDKEREVNSMKFNRNSIVTIKVEPVTEFTKKVYVYVDGQYLAENIYDNIVDEDEIKSYVEDCIKNDVIPNL